MLEFRRGHRVKRVALGFACLLTCCVFLVTNAVAASQADALLEAWDQYKKGDIETALNNALSQYNPNRTNSPVLTTLLGHIFRKKNDPEQSLRYFDEGRPELSNVVWGRASEPVPDDVKEAYRKMYLGLLVSSAQLHMDLRMCAKTMIDVKEIALIQSGDEATATGTALSQMALCKYKLQQYADASKLFSQANAEFPRGLLKDEAAYNAAAMFAKLNDVEGCIKWLQVAGSSDSRQWVDKALQDEDFKDVINDPNIVDFIKQTTK